MKSLDQFFHKIHKVLSGRYAGDFRSKQMGTGVERSELRKYISGDSMRTINRKRSARHDELFTDVLQQEQDIYIDLVCDINANRLGGFEQKNSDKALELITDVIAFARQQHGHIRFLYSQGESLHVSHYTSQQAEQYQQLHNMHTTIVQTPHRYHSQLRHMLAHILRKANKRMIVIIADFLDLDDALIAQLHYIQQHHAAFLYQIPIRTEQGSNYTAISLPASKQIAFSSL